MSDPIIERAHALLDIFAGPRRLIAILIGIAGFFGWLMVERPEVLERWAAAIFANPLISILVLFFLLLIGLVAVLGALVAHMWRRRFQELSERVKQLEDDTKALNHEAGRARKRESGLASAFIECMLANGMEYRVALERVRRIRTEADEEFQPRKNPPEKVIVERRVNG